MSIENIMFFALGLCAAGLLALLIVPAIWRRAVRLTTRRIEAATPMSMAEFRADKDQLRAEFALSTRKLEMTIEQLRARLAEQVSDLSARKSDLSGLKAERDAHAKAVQGWEDRTSELQRRVSELEKDNADLTQRLRMRDRDFAAKSAELETARDSLRARLPQATTLDARRLSGDYAEDSAALLAALAIEQKRSLFLEEQVRLQSERIKDGSRTLETSTDLRDAFAEKSLAANAQLRAAEESIASAEDQLNALLDDDEGPLDRDAHRRSLAETLSLDDQVERLREQVSSIEASILHHEKDRRLPEVQMRDQLAAIASEVSRLVYAADGASASSAEESLFDRVQRFADDGTSGENYSVSSTLASAPGTGSLSERMRALRDVQKH